jgi:hypothetical protein
MMAFKPAWNAADWTGNFLSIFGFLTGSLTGVFALGRLWGAWQNQILLWIFSAVFFAVICLAPYRMFKADESRRENERADDMKRHADLMAKLERMEDRASRNSCLATLIADGTALKDRRVDTDDQHRGWLADYQGWSDRVQTEIATAFSPADATIVSMVNYAVDRVPGAKSGHHQAGVCRIAAILAKMQAMHGLLLAAAQYRDPTVSN